jgi:hypothetical protein
LAADSLRVASRCAAPRDAKAIASAEHVLATRFGGHGVGQVLDVVARQVVGKWVDAALLEAAPKAPPTVFRPLRFRHAAELVVTVEIHQPPGMAVAHPDGGHARDDVVVVHPAVVLRELAMIDIAPAADARAAEREQSGRIRFELREHASAGANRRHGRAQGMAREPRSLIVFSQRGLN